MNKRRPTTPPLAKWTGMPRKVRLALDYDTGHDVRVLLLSVANMPRPPLSTAPGIGRAAGRALAAELLDRPAFRYLNEGPVRMTVSEANALSLLAWLLSNPNTHHLPATLLPLRDCLHQLLT